MRDIRLSATRASTADQVPATRLKVIHVSELPSGWLGKTHAMWTAGQQATGDWLLFTDADVLFKPDTLRRAVAYAEAETRRPCRAVSAHDHEDVRARK